LTRESSSEDIVIRPGDSFCQPVLSYDVYHSAEMRETAPDRALRIAVLSRESHNYSTTRLVAEGESEGGCHLRPMRMWPELRSCDLSRHAAAPP
jgi:ribosomal protein S6--L-glutamate ligase